MFINVITSRQIRLVRMTRGRGKYANDRQAERDLKGHVKYSRIFLLYVIFNSLNNILSVKKLLLFKNTLSNMM